MKINKINDQAGILNSIARVKIMPGVSEGEAKLNIFNINRPEKKKGCFPLDAALFTIKVYLTLMRFAEYSSTFPLPFPEHSSG